MFTTSGCNVACFVCSTLDVVSTGSGFACVCGLSQLGLDEDDEILDAASQSSEHSVLNAFGRWEWMWSGSGVVLHYGSGSGVVLEWF